MPSAAVKLGSPLAHYRDRPDGHPRIQVVAKLPKELVDAAKRLGRRSLTAGLVQLLDEAVDARAVLGDEGWSQVEVRAAQERKNDGEALGGIALEALEKKGGRR